jgi:hypothetical protein
MSWIWECMVAVIPEYEKPLYLIYPISRSLSSSRITPLYMYKASVLHKQDHSQVHNASSPQFGSYRNGPRENDNQNKEPLAMKLLPKTFLKRRSV